MHVQTVHVHGKLVRSGAFVSNAAKSTSCCFNPSTNDVVHSPSTAVLFKPSPETSQPHQQNRHMQITHSHTNRKKVQNVDLSPRTHTWGTTSSTARSTEHHGPIHGTHSR